MVGREQKREHVGCLANRSAAACIAHDTAWIEGMAMKVLIATTAVLAAVIGASATPSLAGRASAASPHEKARHYAVAIRVSGDQPVVVGDTLTIRGKVRPGASGDQVRLQVHYQGRKKWKTLDTTSLNSRSRYTFRDTVGSTRNRWYRVVKAATKHAAFARSEAVKVRAYSWVSLLSLYPSTNDPLLAATATMGGVVYPGSLRSTTNPSMRRYPTDYDCLSLEATYGLDDSSPAGSTATITQKDEEGPNGTGTYVRGQVAHIVTDIHSFAFTLEVTTTGGGIGVIGTPRVLCDQSGYLPDSQRQMRAR